LKGACKTALHKVLSEVMQEPRITQGLAQMFYKTALVKAFYNVYDFCQAFAVGFLKKTFFK